MLWVFASQYLESLSRSYLKVLVGVTMKPGWNRCKYDDQILLIDDLNLKQKDSYHLHQLATTRPANINV